MKTIKAGDKAPAFSAQNQYAERISLSDFKGKKIVLYFYPKDDTPGCTAEACNLRDNHESLTKQGYTVIGVSPDDAASHSKFAKKYDLPFHLIADTDKSILNKYGAWGEKKNYGKTYEGVLRTTFIIDEAGIIERIIKTVDTKEHSKQILI